MLFTGTMRSNLDPFGNHSDAECWQSLRRANLAGLVEGSPAGLDMQLSAGGAPLSAGQKQLVALARALLQRSKVRACVHPPYALALTLRWALWSSCPRTVLLTAQVPCVRVHAWVCLSVGKGTAAE